MLLVGVLLGNFVSAFVESARVSCHTLFKCRSFSKKKIDK